MNSIPINEASRFESKIDQIIPISSSQYIENTLRVQYGDKIKVLETKYNESQSLIKELNDRLRVSEQTIIENHKKYEEEKKSLNFNLQRLRSERNENRNLANNIDQELSIVKQEKSNYIKLFGEYEIRLKTLNDKMARYEEDKNKKMNRMREIEVELLKAKNNEITETNINIISNLEETNRKQKEIINNMWFEVMMAIEDNKKDQLQIENYENLIKQKEFEINLIRKQLADIKDVFINTIDVNYIVTSQVYLDLENLYNTTVSERQSLQGQLDTKNALIRDLEIRLKASNEKGCSFYKNINDLKAQIQIYENKELESNKLIDGYLLQMKSLNFDNTLKTSKIGTLEQLLQAKEVRIEELQVLIKEKESQLLEINRKLKFNNEEFEISSQQLQKKFKEIQESLDRKHSDERLFCKMNEINIAIVNQNKLISVWKDNNNLVEKVINNIEMRNEEQEHLISYFKNYVEELRSKLNDYSTYTTSFKAFDDKMTSVSIAKSQQDLKESSLYLQLQEKLSNSEGTNKYLMQEINNYRTDIQNALKEKCYAVNEVEVLKQEVKLLNKRIEVINGVKLDFESKMQKQMEFKEIEQTNIMNVNNRVENFRGECEKKLLEIEKVFTEIDEKTNC